MIMTLVVWVLFFTHILLVPFILNWNTIHLYGGISHEMHMVMTVIHIFRVLVPAAFLLLWIYTQLLFLIFCPFALVYFYGSLVASIALQSMNGFVLSSMLLNLFIGVWVSFSVYGIKQFMEFGRHYDNRQPGSRSNHRRFLWFTKYFRCYRATTASMNEDSDDTSIWNPDMTLDAARISDLKTVEMAERGEIDACAICLESLQKDMISTSCGHVFHTKCLLKWAKRKTVCPLCNNYLKSGKIEKTEATALQDMP